MKTFPILRAFGVELTRTQNGMRCSWDGESVGDVDQRVFQKIRDYLSERGAGDIASVHNDPGVAEFSSSIMCSYDHLRLFYSRCDGAASKSGLVPNTDSFWGGGGHVTVNYGKIGTPSESIGCETYTMESNPELYRFAFKVHRALAEMPFISWAFGDPGDNHTHVLFDLTSSPEHIKRQRAWISERIRHAGYFSSTNLLPLDSTAFKSALVDPHVNLSFTDNETPIRVRHRAPYSYRSKLFPEVSPQLGSSVEFRFFGTAVDWEMQLAHVEFAQAFTEWVDNEFSASVDDIYANFNRLRSDKKACIKEFKTFIEKTLLLNWKRYERFVEYIELRHDVYGKDFLN